MSGADSSREVAHRLPASGAVSVSLPHVSVVGCQDTVVSFSENCIPTTDNWTGLVAQLVRAHA